jgi:YggT family protein
MEGSSMVEHEEHIEERRTRDGFEREQVVESRGSTRVEVVSRVNQLVWLFFAVVMGLIAIRVVLKLIAANPANAFASFIYGLTDIFLVPFVGLTATPATETGMVLEIPSIIAIFVYALVAFVLVTLIATLFGGRGTSRRMRFIRRRRE